MADKQFDSIIDAFLADREPEWKDLNLADAKKSGEEQQDRTHQYVDHEFMDEIAESASHHTPIPPTSKGATLRNRLQEKEKAPSRISAVQANWHKEAYPREDEFKNSEIGDNESLMNEVTESIEAAYSSGNLKENSADKKEVSDAAVQKYLKGLLNSGMSPNKVAEKLNKLAELELLNHQSATDYLQRNAGMLGLAYLEPNSFMDKENPNYRYDRSASSNDCVRQQSAWKQSGITPRAKSVKQVKACADCSYFKKDASGKRCNLYHLPVVANAEELSQIVNNLTPGVPLKQKRAALVQIANRTDERVQSFDAGKTAQTSIVKTADTSIRKQAQRVQPLIRTFGSEHLAKLHEKGVPLRDAYKWADNKFGSVETSVAFRGFVQTLRKNDKGKIMIAAADLRFLNSIGIRGEQYEAGAKCASCPKHFSREARPIENERGAMRVEGKFAQRTAGAAAAQQKEAAVVEITPAKIRALHQKGHSIERIFKAAANKIGTVEAKRAVATYLANLKRVPGRIQVNASDKSFLIRVGFKAEALRTLESVRRPADQVVATSGGAPILAYPGMGKNASSDKVPEDGRSILNEYDLSGPVVQQDIDISEPQRLDIESKSSFSLDE